jgi:outer membrane protein TolC
VPDAAARVVPTPFGEFPVDLETALGLAGAENPTIALAREAVAASLAAQLQARALLLPSLNAGGNYRNHQGNLQAGTGRILSVDSQSLYVGSGAGAVGSGTALVPGVRVFAHLADAIYEPHAAAHRVAGRRLDALAVRNDVLLDVASAYLDLVGAEARLLALRESEADYRAVARQTAAFARTGQGRQADADRARADLLLSQADLQRAQEEAEAAAAELARLLNFDPAVRLRPPAGLVPLVELVDPRAGLEELVQVAVRNRPEVGARSEDVAFNEVRLREERARPLLPLLSAGFSAGGFGGGSDLVDTRFGHFDGRTDADVYAVWTLRNFGLGDVAVWRERRAEVGEAEAARAAVIARVRQEVAEAYALAADRRGEAETARRRLASASEAFREDLTRARNLEGRPIEVLNSAGLLRAAREDYVRAVVGYDQAEFRLFVALGQPPTLAVPAANAACNPPHDLGSGK